MAPFLFLEICFRVFSRVFPIFNDTNSTWQTSILRKSVVDLDQAVGGVFSLFSFSILRAKSCRRTGCGGAEAESRPLVSARLPWKWRGRPAILPVAVAGVETRLCRFPVPRVIHQATLVFFPSLLVSSQPPTRLRLAIYIPVLYVHTRRIPSSTSPSTSEVTPRQLDARPRSHHIPGRCCMVHTLTRRKHAPMARGRL